MALADRGIETDADADSDPDSDGRSFPSYVLVLEGQARAAAAVIKSEMMDYVPPRVRVVTATGSGDDTIVDVVTAIVENFNLGPEGASCLVVTADRDLRRRCGALGAAATGPGWLLGLL